MFPPRGRSLVVALLALVAVVVALGGAAAAWRHQHPSASPVEPGTHPPSTSAPKSPGPAGSTTFAPGGQERQPGLAALAAKAQLQALTLQQAAGAVQLTLATFNTLGASHTAAHGKDPRMASGSVRGSWVGSLVVAHRVDVVALQEFQVSQAAAFEHAVGSAYAVWPGTTGSAHDGENSVAWRTDRFELVKTVKRYYPYFFGRPRLFPLVLLRDRHSGTEFWVTSFHNPANTAEFGNQARWKARALAAEIPDIRALLASTRLPLVVAGDMNDHAGFFCPVVAGTTLHAANGGSSSGGVCRVPRPRAIDWILGSPEVRFSGYRWDHSTFVRRTSDHPMVLTEATILRGAGQPRVP